MGNARRGFNRRRDRTGAALPPESPAPSYLILGHVTHDMLSDALSQGCRPGGTAFYAAIAAQRLGEKVALVTSAASDFNFAAALPGIPIINIPTPTTTIFENRLTAAGRRQRLLARARDLASKHVPLSWRRAPIVHLAPIAGELAPELIDIFPDSLVGVTAQGWLRQWNAAGVVSFAALPFHGQRERIFSRADAVILSEEDVEDTKDTEASADNEDIEDFKDELEDDAAISAYASLAKLLVVTTGERGASVYYRGERRDLPAYPTVVVDPTGAGDVFAAAYLVSLSRGADPFAAADFANCAASFAIEMPGTLGIPTFGMVSKRISAM